MWGYGGHGGWMMGGQDGGWFWPMFAMHGIGGFLVLALAVYVVVVLVRGGGFGASRREVDPALELLGRRYVAGEISQTDYLRMKKDLRG